MMATQQYHKLVHFLVGNMTRHKTHHARKKVSQ